MKPRPWLVGILFAVLTILIFGQTLKFGFVAFDDNMYVDQNAKLKLGLSLDGIRWAFSANFFNYTDEAEYWEPLTLLTRLADYQFYGFNPWGHHLTSVLIHLATSLVLLGTLRTLTGAFWKSALVAALFLVHPMHVEPVVWLSARKDLVSGFFYILAIWAYALHQRKPDGLRYGLLWMAVLAANMAKPMAVSLPFVFLLLDFWPLGRWNIARGETFKGLSRLLLEKAPFFAIAVLVSWMAYQGQKNIGAMSTNDLLSLPWRLGNVALATMTYVCQAVFPHDLTIYYPHPGKTLNVPLAEASAGILLLLTGAALWQWKRRPWAVTGWFWFLVVLAPVSGIIQIGDQAMADRYSYLSFIGLFIAMVWEASHWIERWCARRQNAPVSPRPVILFSSGIVLVHAVAAFCQTMIWQNNLTLFSHALEVTKNNYVVEFNLGTVLWRLGREEEALQHLQAAQNIHWPITLQHIQSADAAIARGDYATAISNLTLLITFAPWDWDLHFKTGNVLLLNHQPTMALAQFNEALKYRRNWNAPRFMIVETLLKMGKPKLAETVLNQALQLEPDSPEGLRLAALLKNTK